MLSQLLPPLVNRRVGDTQFSGYLCNRLAAGLRQLHCLLFECSCVNVLDLCHAKPFPDLLEYISALGTLPNRGRLTRKEARKLEPASRRRPEKSTLSKAANEYICTRAQSIQ